MSYEVELKFPLDDASAVMARLKELGAVPGETVEQADLYFRHPARDFGATDEALRIRTSGAENRVTYKGPRVDTQTKTRREIEIPFGSGADIARDMQALLTALGFEAFHTVRKSRTTCHLEWDGRHVEISLDDVQSLGRFLEIEVIAEEETRKDARDSILQLAREIGLENSERKSYLCLLLEKAGR